MTKIDNSLFKSKKKVNYFLFIINFCMEKAIHRLFKYLEKKGIAPARLEKELGLSNGYLRTMLKRNADMGEGVIMTIIDNCLDLDLNWLLTGKTNYSRNVQEDPISYLTSENTQKLSPEREMIETLTIAIRNQASTIALLEEKIEYLSKKKQQGKKEDGENLKRAG